MIGGNTDCDKGNESNKEVSNTGNTNLSYDMDSGEVVKNSATAEIQAYIDELVAERDLMQLTSNTANNNLGGVDNKEDVKSIANKEIQAYIDELIAERNLVEKVTNTPNTSLCYDMDTGEVVKSMPNSEIPAFIDELLAESESPQIDFEHYSASCNSMECKEVAKETNEKERTLTNSELNLSVYGVEISYHDMETGQVVEEFDWEEIETMTEKLLNGTDSNQPRDH